MKQIKAAACINSQVEREETEGIKQQCQEQDGRTGEKKLHQSQLTLQYPLIIQALYLKLATGTQGDDICTKQVSCKCSKKKYLQCLVENSVVPDW